MNPDPAPHLLHVAPHHSAKLTLCLATVYLVWGSSFLFSKIAVTGAQIHPLYKELIAAKPVANGTTREGFRERLAGFLAKRGETPNPEPGILWNFEKFLVGRDGTVVARFSPEIVPDDPQIVDAIEATLAG